MIEKIPDWPPIVVVVDCHNGDFAEAENEPKTQKDNSHICRKNTIISW